MASDKGAFKDVLDERLAEVRDGILLQGEDVIAQVEADQGQALVLTKFRVLVVKVGLTATGTLNGQIANVYPLEKITAVNVRKGPMGAVIQILTDEKEPSVPGAPPGNVVIFSDPRKASACEAIGIKIEEVLGRPVEKIGPPSGEAQPAERAPEAPVEELCAEPAAEQAVESEPAVEPVEELHTEPEIVAEEASPEPPRAPEENQVSEAVPTIVVEKPKARKPQRSLADEIYAEVVGTEPGPEEQAQAARGAERPKPIIQIAKQDAEAPEPVKPAEEFHPNPRLPKPAAKRVGGRKPLVLIGSLLALVIAGIALIAPMRMSNGTQPAKIDLITLTKNASSVNGQHSLVLKYLAEVEAIIKQDDSATGKFRDALTSGNRDAIAAAAKLESVQGAWQKLSTLKAPAGLAGAKESLTTGMFLRKNTVANVMSSLQSSTAASMRTELSKLAEADASVRRGMDAINKMASELEAKMEKMKAERAR